MLPSLDGDATSITITGLVDACASWPGWSGLPQMTDPSAYRPRALAAIQ
jgi:hypothetical protein